LGYDIQGTACTLFTKLLRPSTEENKIKPILQTIRTFRAPLILFLFLYLLIVFTHRLWLPYAADFLVIGIPPQKADLVVVATPFRPRFLHALDLFQKGYAKQILLVGDNRIKSLWNGKTTSELAKLEAINRGVPESKIHVKHSTGTRADALQTKTLMLTLGLKSTLIISDPYNMRRLAMIFDNIFKDSGLELSLAPTNQERKNPDYWWISPHSFVYVIKEWIKLPINYYLLSSTTTKDIEPPQEPKEKTPGKFIEPTIKNDDLFSRNFSQKITRLINFKIGEFLVVDENKKTPGIAITPKLSERVSTCYSEGICKKIFFFSGGSGYPRDPKKIHSQARKLGIDLGDLTIIPHALGDAYQTTHFLNQFLEENQIKTANIFLPYYETRKFQFYFNRFQKPEFTIHPIPLESKYRHLLEHWRHNAGLANLYLDQYLIMSHYYFNKILWSSNF
jgi:uncharacterized SAM-binding protein YcdF (DUF218 family)